MSETKDARVYRGERPGEALAEYLVAIVQNVPAGADRDSAINRAIESKFWSVNGIGLG